MSANPLQKVVNLFDQFILGTIPNTTCKNHMKEVWTHYHKKESWALQMMDSMTRFPVGVLTGHSTLSGNMEQCTEVNVDENFGSFTGKHCLVNFQLPVPPRFGPGAAKVAQVRWGVCMPSTCSAKDLRYLLKYGFHLPAHFDELDCQTVHDERPFQPREIFTFFVIAILLLLILLSTIYDKYTSPAKKNNLLVAFSITRNFKTLMDTSVPPGGIKIIHGTHSIAIFMVVLAHTYMMSSLGQMQINILKYGKWLSDWNHVWLTSRGIFLNMFFFSSGMLITYLFMKDREKGRKFNFILYCIHRIMRIAPVTYMMLLITSTLTNRLSSAPRWKAYSRNIEGACDEHWWKYALFIQSWLGNLECMEHMWYLSVDIQLYILSPIVLFPLHRWPKAGLGFAFGVIVISSLGSFTSSYVLKEKGDLLRNTFRQERNLYELPFHRISPWVIGMICGHILYKISKSKEINIGEVNSKDVSIKGKCIKWVIGYLLLAAAFSMLIGMMFAVHPFIQLDYEYNGLQVAAYLASSYVVSALAFALFLVINLAGYGGIFNTILTSKVFVPLSRLSFCIYVTHFMVTNLWFMSTQGPEFLSDIDLLRSWISISIYTLPLSSIMFLMVEQPFAVIDKIIQNKDSSQDLMTKPLLNNPRDASVVYLTSSENGGQVNNGLELSEVHLGK